MKKIMYLFLGVVIGTLVGTSFSYADTPIKLIVNGKQINSDVPPQIINGRTMIPARFLAEALGSTVSWDDSQNAVIVTSQPVTQQQSQASAPGLTLDNYFKIKKGMTLQQVNDLLGMQGTLKSTYNANQVQSTTFEWAIGDLTKVNVDFEHGVVSSMYQIGLN